MTTTNDVLVALSMASDATTIALNRARDGNGEWRGAAGEAWAAHERGMELEAQLAEERDQQAPGYWRQVADATVDQIVREMIARPMSEAERRRRAEIWQALCIEAGFIETVLVKFSGEVAAVLRSDLDPVVAAGLLEARTAALGLPALEAERTARRVLDTWKTA